MNYSTFEEMRDYYRQILEIKEVDSFPVVIVGNKADVEEEDREVEKASGQDVGGEDVVCGSVRGCSAYAHVPASAVFVQYR